MKYEIGINTNCECGNNYRETLDNIKASGIKHVMISEKCGNFEDAIKYALKIGLGIPFVHLAYQLADNIWVTGANHNEYVNGIIRGLDFCGKYGIKTAIMHLQRSDCVYTLVKPSDVAITAMQKILTAAERNNCHVAVENLDSYNLGHLQYILDNVKSPRLGLCYDCGHHNLYTPNIDLLKKYRGRIHAVHLHDNMLDWHPGMDVTRDMHMLPGDGKIDFGAVLREIKEAGYNKTLIFEFHRITTGEPHLYKNLTPAKFLEKALEKITSVMLICSDGNNN